MVVDYRYWLVEFQNHANVLPSGDISHFPDGTISQIGYGVRGGQEQTLERMIRLLSDIGFKIRSQDNNNEWFEIQAVKI